MNRARRLAVVAAALAASFLWVAPVNAQKTELLVYTALETDQLKAYEEGFYKAVPDVSLKWVRDSTGVITSKLLAGRMDVAAMCEFIHADSLAFVSIDGLYRAVGLSGRNNACPQYCDACFTGDYPTALTDLAERRQADAQLSFPVNKVA